LSIISLSSPLSSTANPHTRGRALVLAPALTEIKASSPVLSVSRNNLLYPSNLANFKSSISAASIA